MKPEDQPIEPGITRSTERDQAQDALPAASVPVGFRSTWDDGTQQGEPSAHSKRPSSLSDQDTIATPVPFTEKPMSAVPGDRPERALRSLRMVTGFLLLISLLSLALSGFLFFSLLKVRQTFNDGLDTAIQAIDSFEGKGFQYEYRFERMIPVSATIPIEQDLAFPFEGDIPINTTVQVPIDAGILGTFNVSIPINTSVYVDTSVPVKVDQRFEVSTTIPVSMTIPIDIQPGDPAIQGLLNQVRRWLVRLKQSY
jgi:hypothetical protein